MPSTELIALWGAITGTAALIVSLLQVGFSVRRHLFESPKLQIDKVSAGMVHQGNLHIDSITAFLLNAGAFKLSVQSYHVEIYESRWNLFLRRPNRIVHGDGHKMKLEGGKVIGYLKPTDLDSVPFSIDAGCTQRIDMNDPGLWPDRKWRRVFLSVRYAPPKSVIRKEIIPQAHNYSDPASVKQAIINIAEALRNVNR